jgi:hypothetical protein
MSSTITWPTAQAVNSNISNDGSADSPRGWAISTNADYTFTATGPSRARCTATSANRSVNLPTTGIKAGYEAEVVTACTSPYTITVKSSNGNTVDTMIGTKGRIRCVALIDTPLASGDWEVVQVEDYYPGSATLTFAGGATKAVTFALMRVAKSVTGKFGAVGSEFYVTSASASGSASLPAGAIPATFRPFTQTQPVIAPAIDNGTGQSLPALFVIGTNGSVTIYKTGAAGGFTGGVGGVTGLERFSFSWIT